MSPEDNNYGYDSEEVRGYCKEHAGPLINVPQVSKGLIMSESDRASLVAGIWGVGFCPLGNHFEIWTMRDTPPDGENALVEYLQKTFKINLDIFDNLI